MAWNEPGKNGNDNDPWKNRGGRDQGPPDLDEVFRKFSNKFGGLFGGKSGAVGHIEIGDGCRIGAQAGYHLPGFKSLSHLAELLGIQF